MKNIIRRILYGKPSEESRLVARATAFPRHKPTEIMYRNYRIRVTDMLSVAWQIHEFFVGGRMKFKSADNAPLIIDCGANVGVSVLYYHHLFSNAQVFCFEPDPAVFACLEENMRKNEVGNVECRQEAVWVNADGVSFGGDGADGGSILRQNDAVHIPSIRLKDVLQRYERIDLLKIDIEGAETEVLVDCADALKRVKHLYVEYHSFPDREQDLHRLLAVMSEQGFRYFIERVGAKRPSPFIEVAAADMDLQLDIHAIRE